MTQSLRDSHLTRRAVLNAVAPNIDFAVQAVIAFLINPLLLAYLGSSLFGIWQILERMVGYLSVTENRPTEALKWVIAYERESNDWQRKQRQIGATFYAWLFFLPLVGVAGAGLIFLAPRLISATAEQAHVIRLATLLLVFRFMIFGLAAIPSAVLVGMNLGYRRLGLKSTRYFLAAAGGLGALELGWSLTGLAAAQVFATLVFILLMWRIAISDLSWIRIRKPIKGETKGFIRYGGWFLSWSLVVRLLIGSDLLILGFLISPEAVTVYVFTNFLARWIPDFAFRTGSGLSVGIAGIFGQGRYHQAARLRSEQFAGVWLLCVSAGVAILLLNNSFVSLYVGRDQYGGPIVTLLVIILALQFAFIQLDGTNISLTLDIRAKVGLGVVGAILSVLLALALGSEFGIAGVCTGMMIGRSVLSIGYPRIVCSALGISFVSQLRTGVRPFLTMVILLGASFWMGQSLSVASWPALIGAAGVGFIGAAGIAFFAGLPVRSRKMLLKRVRIAQTQFLPSRR